MEMGGEAQHVGCSFRPPSVESEGDKEGLKENGSEGCFEDGSVVEVVRATIGT